MSYRDDYFFFIYQQGRQVFPWLSSRVHPTEFEPARPYIRITDTFPVTVLDVESAAWYAGQLQQLSDSLEHLVFLTNKRK